MPLFMDVHNRVEGLTRESVAGVHERDLEVEDKYGVKYPRCWLVERSARVFRLVEAPDAETAARLHREAHGPEADEIVPVHDSSGASG